MRCFRTQEGPNECKIPQRIHTNVKYWLLVSLFFNLFIFNWRIIALQYWWTWISQRYTYVPSLLNLPPMSYPIPPVSFVTEPLFEFPESYSKSPWIYLHVGVYMSPCNPFHHPTLFFLLLCPHVCSLCLHLHCRPAHRFINTIFQDSIYMH